MFLANFVKIDMVKLKENRELGVLTLGIKRDGHQKTPGIRRDDCIFFYLYWKIGYYNRQPNSRNVFMGDKNKVRTASRANSAWKCMQNVQKVAFYVLRSAG